MKFLILLIPLIACSGKNPVFVKDSQPPPQEKEDKSLPSAPTPGKVVPSRAAPVRSGVDQPHHPPPPPPG